MAERGMVIQSHKGPYPVRFGAPFAGLEKGLGSKEYLIIDSRVADLYSSILAPSLDSPRVLRIEATEKNKSLEKIPDYVLALTAQGIKRGCMLVAVGGGILQDITAFLAAILFRGVPWKFYPTTLLAQADSCIGSKSSINVGGYKNQVGTFTPPEEIHIATEVLETLTDADFRSGIGEMIKVHLIKSWGDFKSIQKNYPRLKKDKKILGETICRSLEIKKELIEIDEFDKKERLVLNYGHSFGHAMEGATDYEIPHGIAVTMGVDMANFVSKEFGFLSEEVYREMQGLLRENDVGFEKVVIPLDRFFESIAKDKKNMEKDVSLILTKGPGSVFRDRYPNDERFQTLCAHYFKGRSS